MKKITPAILALFLCAWGHLACAQMASFFPGPGSPASSGGTYQGPADIVASPKIWVGLRAMSTADRGNRLINICDPANVTCADWSSDATTGKLVVGTNPLNGTDCSSATTCTVKTAYDRSGTLGCSGACDVTNATAANRPTFNWNAGNPFVVFTAANSQKLCSVTFASTQAQPFSYSWVADRTSGTGFQNVMGNTSAAAVAGFNNSANNLVMYTGALATVAATDNVFHAVQNVFNGASSNFYVDGSQTTVNPSTGGFGPSQPLCIGAGNDNANFMNGNWREAGFWAGATSTPNEASLNSQQHTFWSF